MKLTSNQERLVEQNESLQRMRERMITREAKSEETFRRYLDGIKNLQNQLKASNPDELLAILKKSDDLTDVLDNWVATMQKDGKHANNIKSMLMGVKKYLFSNRINGVEWSFVGRPKVTGQIRDRIPTDDELRRTLSNKTNYRDKALFLTATTSGLRIGTIASLRISDLTPYENTAFITVTGAKGRKLAEGKEYHSWVTPEAYNAIQDYLKTRGNPRPDEPLFAKLANGEENLSIYPQNIARVWLEMLMRAKLLKKIENHRMYDLHVHTLRKFFQTKTKIAGCKTGFVDLWLGHVVSEYLNGSYFRPDIRESYTEYKKAIPALTIFGKEQIELQTVKNEMQTLKEKLQEKDKEIIELRMMLQPIAQMLKNLPEHAELQFVIHKTTPEEEQTHDEEIKEYEKRNNPKPIKEKP